MKTLFSAIAFLLVTNFAYAQTEGTITFETKFNLHRNLTEDKADMKAMMPEFDIRRQILTFNATESFFKPLVDENDDVAAATGNQQIMIRRPMEVTYLNNAQKICVMQRELMGKTYLIRDSLAVLPWKFANDTKTVQGYTCKKAYFTNVKTGKLTVAWYTDKLRPGLGPDDINSLPGAVLEVDIDNGLKVTRATKIVLRPLKKNELAEPVKGEKISDAQFKTLLDERRKQRGGGGNVIIRN